MILEIGVARALCWVDTGTMRGRRPTREARWPPFQRKDGIRNRKRDLNLENVFLQNGMHFSIRKKALFVVFSEFAISIFRSESICLSLLIFLNNMAVVLCRAETGTMRGKRPTREGFWPPSLKKDEIRNRKGQR